ncbi:MAG: hypothetical protein WC755_07145 [Candidatus Woesearchaeota archaeon]|jgi:hypothetical protein
MRYKEFIVSAALFYSINTNSLIAQELKNTAVCYNAEIKLDKDIDYLFQKNADIKTYGLKEKTNGLFFSLATQFYSHTNNKFEELSFLKGCNRDNIESKCRLEISNVIRIKFQDVYDHFSKQKLSQLKFHKFFSEYLSENFIVPLNNEFVRLDKKDVLEVLKQDKVKQMIDDLITKYYENDAFSVSKLN